MRAGPLHDEHAFRDPQLAGMEFTLGGAGIVQLIQERLLVDGAVLEDCTPVYRRYKPGTSCIASFEVHASDDSSEFESIVVAKAYRRAEYENAAAKLSARSLHEVHPLRSHAQIDEHDLILLSFPNDSELPGLPTLMDAKKVQRILHRVLTEFDPSKWRISDRRLQVDCIRYKPEKRSLLRWRTRAKHRFESKRQAIEVFARVYAGEQSRSVLATARTVARALEPIEGLFVPTPISHLLELGTILTRSLPGRPLVESQSPEDLRRTGVALERVHSVTAEGLPSMDIDELLREALNSVELVATLDSQLQGPARRLWERLVAMAPELASQSLGLVHGDFHRGQVLTNHESVAILDFDRCFVGDPSFDLGNFRAQWLYDCIRSSASPDCVDLTPLFDGYRHGRVEPGSVGLRFWTAYSLIRLCATPFREARPNWKQDTARLLDLCEEELS